MRSLRFSIQHGLSILLTSVSLIGISSAVFASEEVLLCSRAHPRAAATVPLESAIQQMHGARGALDQPARELKLRFALRIAIRQAQDFFLRNGAFATTPMIHFRHDERAGYLSPSQRETLQVQIREGLLLDRDGQLIDTSDASHSKPGLSQGAALYVMDALGRIYISKVHSMEDLFFHSTILAGVPVAAAGMIRVEKGRVTYVDNSSGHYLPTAEYFAQFLSVLDRHGIRPDEIEILFRIGTLGGMMLHPQYSQGQPLVQPKPQSTSMLVPFVKPREDDGK